jgi:hypothetical protein
VGWAEKKPKKKVLELGKDKRAFMMMIEVIF